MGSDCAICHGREGDGKGVLAKDISLNIHNWKDPGRCKKRRIPMETYSSFSIMA